MRLRNIPESYEAIEKSEYCRTDGTILKGKWKDEFKEDKPLRIEVGCGKGNFIIENATRHPEFNFIGIEMYESVLYKGLLKLLKMDERPSNLLFLRADAAGITDFFIDKSIDRIYLNFSDPWPKKRHEKRRLTSPGFLLKYHRILKDGGLIEFKTDNEGLFLYSLEVLKESTLFKEKFKTLDLHNDKAALKDNIMTEYEEKFVRLLKPIYKIVYEKV